MLFCGLLAVPARALAQADEVQVYDGGIAPRGVFNLTIHNNWIAKGVTTPAFPGGVTPDRSLNGVPEWAVGVTRWFEAGLYLPLYTWDRHRGWGLDGFKLRTLVTVPNGGERRFVYGLGTEFSYNARQWDTTRITSEFRPIVGWHLKNKVDVIVNPILDTAYDGLKNMEFVPSGRIAYNRSESRAYALEFYSAFGPLHGFLPVGQQSHQVFAVINHVTRSGLEIEAGAGVGLNSHSERVTFKLILSRDLNRR